MMMTESHNIELLDELLDGATPPPAAQSLRARASADPAIAATLENLQAERQARAAAWSQLEPSDADARAFADRLIDALHERRQRRRHALQIVRAAAAIAACVILAFFGGWI